MGLSGHSKYILDLIVRLIQIFDPIKQALPIALPQAHIGTFERPSVDLILVERRIHIIFHLEVRLPQIFVLLAMRAHFLAVIGTICIV